MSPSSAVRKGLPLSVAAARLGISYEGARRALLDGRLQGTIEIGANGRKIYSVDPAALDAEVAEREARHDDEAARLRAEVEALRMEVQMANAAIADLRTELATARTELEATRAELEVSQVEALRRGRALAAQARSHMEVLNELTADAPARSS